jgi:hypothetical protein
LLIEDCAACVQGADVGLVGDCSLFSFKYDKPLSVGWGGAISIPADSRIDLDNEPSVPMDPECDTIVAASFILQHTATSADRYRNYLRMDYFLMQMREMVGLAEKVLDYVESGTDDRILARIGQAVSTNGGKAVCLKRRVLGICQRVGRTLGVVHRESTAKPRRSWQEGITGRTLRSDGWATRILLAQAQCRQQTELQRRRITLANKYVERLDTDKFDVPRFTDQCDFSPLRIPVAYRNPTRDFHIQWKQLGENLQVEIAPFNWPKPLHLVDELRQVRVPHSLDASERRVAGLLNLPVHSGMSMDCVDALCESLNRIA